MTDKKAILKLKQLVNIKEDLKEGVKLIELSTQIFQKKIGNIRKKIVEETDQKKIQILISDADKIYKDYQKTLNIIRSYMRDVYLPHLKNI